MANYRVNFSLFICITSNFHKTTTCIVAIETISFSKQIYYLNNCLRGNINWALRSYNLTPLDFFLCDYLKEKVDADDPQSLDDIENIIDYSRLKYFIISDLN